jgi:hypothetical protein
MPTPLSADLHNLIVRPGNSSMVLGAGHHMLYRPANAAAKLFGGSVPKALDPEEWGASLARAGDRIDHRLAIGGSSRQESISLENAHIHSIGAHLDTLRKERPSDAGILEERLNSLVRDHYNSQESIQGLVDKAKADPQFAATFHGVVVPSLTGEVGRSVKNVATDVAALYGSAELIDHARRAAQPDHTDKKGHLMLSNIDRAQELIAKTASILASLPVKEQAHEKAAQLLESGVITAAEVEKIAAVFERNPDEADAIAAGMMRGQGYTEKGANLGEVVIDEPSTKSGSVDRFTQACLNGLR